MNTPATVPGRRRTLWVLLLLFFAPLATSFWLYYGSTWRPAGRTNHGELIEPPRNLAGFRDAAADALFTRKWSLVYVGDGGCDADCRTALHMMRQTHAALGRLETRVQQVFMASSGCCNREFLVHEHPALRVIDASGASAADVLTTFDRNRTQRGIFIVDPLGNLMMRYDTGREPKGLLQDLKKLLELSHIG